MNAREFCYWLQGHFEIGNVNESGLGTGPRPMSSTQVEMIQRHLALVFKHDIDPSQGSASHQAELQSIHDGKPVRNEDPSKMVMRC